MSKDVITLYHGKYSWINSSIGYMDVVCLMWAYKRTERILKQREAMLMERLYGVVQE